MAAIPAGFPAQLLAALSDPASVGIAEWLPHGHAFAIKDLEALARIILPRFTRGKLASSLQQQLDLYGFVEISTGRDAKGGVLAYFHPAFKRDRPEMLAGVMRMAREGAPTLSRFRDEHAPHDTRMPTEHAARPEFHVISFDEAGIRKKRTCSASLEEPLRQKRRKLLMRPLPSVVPSEDAKVQTSTPGVPGDQACEVGSGNRSGGLLGPTMRPFLSVRLAKRQARDRETPPQARASSSRRATPGSEMPFEELVLLPWEPASPEEGDTRTWSEEAGTDCSSELEDATARLHPEEAETLIDNLYWDAVLPSAREREQSFDDDFFAPGVLEKLVNVRATAGIGATDIGLSFSPATCSRNGSVSAGSLDAGRADEADLDSLLHLPEDAFSSPISDFWLLQNGDPSAFDAPFVFE